MVIVSHVPFDGFYNGRRVLVTGHTGFKGGWLTLWLHRLGATVHGFGLNPPTEPSLFESAGIGTALATDARADLADLARLKVALNNAEPEIVFHLAAQPLVLASYRDPVGTLATNVMGTAHVLEAVRAVHTVRALVLITTDKVYENCEWAYPYREIDRLGGHDPYSPQSKPLLSSQNAFSALFSAPPRLRVKKHPSNSKRAPYFRLLNPDRFFTTSLRPRFYSECR